MDRGHMVCLCEGGIMPPVAGRNMWFQLLVPASKVVAVHKLRNVAVESSYWSEMFAFIEIQ